MENQTPVQIDSLSNFIELCQKEKDFLKILTFKNSVILHFEKTIYSNITDELKKLPNKTMIYHVTNLMTGEIEVCLFIYKISQYEFD